MKQNKNGLIFKPSSQVNIIEELFKAPKFISDRKLLHFKAFYRVGLLTTDMGNDILALKFIENSLDLLLLEPIPGTEEARKIVDQHPHTVALDHVGMPHNEIVPEYNCHGLCFGDSLYRIPDAKQIIEDEYEECDKNDATCAIFYEDDVTVHAASIQDNAISAKAGYRGLHIFDNIEDSAGDISYDSHCYYRPRA